MIQSIKKYLLSHWREFNLSEPIIHDLTFIQISSSRGKKFSKGRIVYLIFLPDEEQPVLTVKMSRDESYDYHLRNEFTNLQNLHSAYEEAVPKPLILDNINNKLVMIEVAVPGLAMNIALQNCVNSPLFSEKKLIDRVENDFNIAKDLIKKFSRLNKKSDINNFRKEFDDIIADFRNNFDAENSLRKDINDSCNMFSALVSGSIFQRVVHCDFILNNILVDKSGNRVIDWEFSNNSTLLFLEPVRFIVYYWKQLYNLKVFNHKVTEFRSFGETVLDDKHWFGRIILMFLQQTLLLNREKIKQLIPLLFLYYFIIESNLQFGVVQYPSNFFKSNFIKWIKLFAKNNKEKFMIEVLKEENKKLINENISLRDETKVLKEANVNLRREINKVRSSPSWKVASFLHRIRKKIPFIKKY